MKPLNDEEVASRRLQHGFNELSEKEKNKIVLFFSEIIGEPMFILLISCASIYLLIGDKLEGSVLLFSVSIIIFITFYQRQKTEKALSELKKLNAPFASVQRANGIIKIKSREIVTDDILILEEGDLVSADASLIESTNLLVNESHLSGESFSVTKSNSLFNDNNKLYAGTFIIQGHAKAIVTEIGNETQLGKIGKSLLEIPSNETRLQKEMNVLVRKLFLTGVLICIAVIFLFYFLRGNFIQSLLIGLSSAMAILPEEFPVVLTVFLTLGSWKLAKNNVLTRYPAAIENLGSTSFLCTDKTGTITENKMELTYTYNGITIFSNPDFLTKQLELTDLITIAYFACPEFSSDPMEIAIRKLASSILNQNLKHTIIKEFSFNKDVMSVTRVIKTDHFFAAVKGAPEEILNRSNLTPEEKTKHIKVLNDFTKKGLRVLGVGKQEFVTENYPIKQEDFKLMFMGWIAFEDPLRVGVKEAVRLCKGAGIKLQLITGDYRETAVEIAKQAEIYTDGMIVSGDELEEMNDEKLSEHIKKIQLFYRVKPLQKLRIVNALKNNNEVVSMTGDGINDAPALKAADVGIAMGKRGTAVAKDAAAIILMDDNFNSIVSGIQLGRRTYDNLQKAFSYIISIHIPIIGLTLLPAFITDFPILLMPIHIVLLELMIDPISSITFEKIKEEKNTMLIPPRGVFVKFFNQHEWKKSIIEGLILYGTTLLVFFISKYNHQHELQIRTNVFIAFVSGNLLLVINQLSRKESIIKSLYQISKPIIITNLIIVTILLLLIIVPYFRSLFKFGLPDFQDLGTILIALIFLALMLSILKRRKRIV